MDFFLEDPEQICRSLNICKTQNCVKLHPRFLSGACIKFLNLTFKNKGYKKKKCMEEECDLNHFNLKKLRKKIQQKPINGVLQFNLCPQAEECVNPDCQYLHRNWINDEKICLKYLDGDCEKEEDEEACKRKHISWNALQQKVQNEYKAFGLVLESLCLKNSNECKVNCQGHSKYLDDYCLLNFQGICNSKGKCLKVHKDWESLKQEQQKIKYIPCVKKLENNLNFLFRKKMLSQIAKNIQEQLVTDVLIIMDCTGSMREWIKMIKNNIVGIINKFKKMIRNEMVRIAFIGYRDFSDADHLVYINFSVDVEKVKTFIEKQEATGGGDSAEDLAGALNLALNLDFADHPDSVLCTFLFCDSPTHGKQYHDINSDDLKHQIPSGQLENLMKKFKKRKINNYFFCFKITNLTDKMFSIMQKNFDGLEIVESQQDKIPDLISFSLMSSYQSSKVNSDIFEKKKENTIRISAKYLRHKRINVNNCKGGEDYESYLQKQMEQQEISGNTILDIEIEPLNIDQKYNGAFANIFKVFDHYNKRYLIAKLPKEIVQKMADQQKSKPNQKQQIEIELKKEAEKSVDIRYYSTLIAQQMAHQYREKTRKNFKAPPIFYVSPIKYELQNQFYGVTRLYAETEIQFPNHFEGWEKITNNAKYIKENCEVYGAFTHLTFEWSNFQLMVTDLQGKCGVFSDPAINTNSENLDKDIRDRTNRGSKGITLILNSQHAQCNELCIDLHLTREDLPGGTRSTSRSKSQGRRTQTDQSNSSLSNINSETLTQLQNCGELKDVSQTDIIQLPNFDSQEVNCVCDICGSIFQIELAEYRNQKEELFLCDDCQSLKKEAACECCGCIFHYYLQSIIKSGQHPSKCQECIQYCNENQKTVCFYCEKNCLRKKIKKMETDQCELLLCEDAQNYLLSLKCQYCKSPYQFKNVLSLNEYISGFYVCKSCQKNDKLKL